MDKKELLKEFKTVILNFDEFKEKVKEGDYIYYIASSNGMPLDVYKH